MSTSKPVSVECFNESCYNKNMDTTNKNNAMQENSARQKLLEAIRLQEIESNSLTPDEIEMFEMFEREGWSDEQCREYIFARFNEKRSNKVHVSPASE